MVLEVETRCIGKRYVASFNKLLPESRGILLRESWFTDSEDDGMNNLRQSTAVNPTTKCNISEDLNPQWHRCENCTLSFSVRGLYQFPQAKIDPYCTQFSKFGQAQSLSYLIFTILISFHNNIYNIHS
jgi:hypothetical protein